jgi:hypothetical protein
MLVGRGEFIEAVQTNRLEKSSVLRGIMNLEARTWQDLRVVFDRTSSILVSTYSSQVLSLFGTDTRSLDLFIKSALDDEWHNFTAPNLINQRFLTPERLSGVIALQHNAKAI